MNYNFNKINIVLFVSGFKQANLVILPHNHSQEFLEFSRGNAGALPLLYMSQPGEFAAPKLCEDSDVRTDVPSFYKFVKGQVETRLDDLLGKISQIYCQDWIA